MSDLDAKFAEEKANLYSLCCVLWEVKFMIVNTRFRTELAFCRINHLQPKHSRVHPVCGG